MTERSTRSCDQKDVEGQGFESKIPIPRKIFMYRITVKKWAVVTMKHKKSHRKDLANFVYAKDAINRMSL